MDFPTAVSLLSASFGPTGKNPDFLIDGQGIKRIAARVSTLPSFEEDAKFQSSIKKVPQRLQRLEEIEKEFPRLSEAVSAEKRRYQEWLKLAQPTRLKPFEKRIHLGILADVVQFGRMRKSGKPISRSRALEAIAPVDLREGQGDTILEILTPEAVVTLETLRKRLEREYKAILPEIDSLKPA